MQLKFGFTFSGLHEMAEAAVEVKKEIIESVDIENRYCFYKSFK